MHPLINISEAFIIAIHTLDYMIRNKKNIYSAKEIAKNLNISYNHLSKVLQRLNAENILNTIRGPNGGYSITEEGKKISTREILYIIEGKKQYTNCLFPYKRCDMKTCVFRTFLDETLKKFNTLLDLKISEIHNVKRD